MIETAKDAEGELEDTLTESDKVRMMLSASQSFNRLASCSRFQVGGNTVKVVKPDSFYHGEHGLVMDLFVEAGSPFVVVKHATGR